MIATYNTNVGDVLMLITANDKGEKVNFERKGKVARVFIEETGATVAWNIFEAKSLLANLSGNGQVDLSSDDIETLNKELGKSGFSDVLVHDAQPKFVVAEIVEMEMVWIIQIQTIYISVKLMLVLPIQYKLFVVLQTQLLA